MSYDSPNQTPEQPLDVELKKEVCQLEYHACQIAGFLAQFQHIVERLGSEKLLKRNKEIELESERLGLVICCENYHPHALGWVNRRDDYGAELCNICDRIGILGTITGHWRCILGCEFSVCGQCLTKLKSEADQQNNFKQLDAESQVLQKTQEPSLKDDARKNFSVEYPARVYSNHSWLWCADHDSPCCLRCGRRFRIGILRHHCQSCGLAVCSDCSLDRLPALPLLRICASCFRENMKQFHDTIQYGIHTETVWNTRSPSLNIGEISTTSRNRSEPGENDPWELVEFERSALRPATLHMSIRPAPVIVSSGTMLYKPRSFFHGRRRRLFVLDSNSMLTCFSKFRYEPGVGTLAVNESPTFIVNMEVCTLLSFNDSLMEGGELSQPRISLTTPSCTFELIFDDWEEAEDWYTSFCLTSRICYECGKPVVFSKTPEERDKTCIIMSNLPSTSRLYHRKCFICSHPNCSSFHASGLILMKSSGRLLTQRQKLSGRLICKRHVLLGLNSDLESSSCQRVTSTPRSTSQLKIIAVDLSEGTKDSIKSLFNKWSARMAAKEALKNTHMKLSNDPICDIKQEYSLHSTSSDAATSLAFLRAATHGVIHMIKSLNHADPASKCRLHTDYTTEFPYELTEYFPFQFDYLRRSTGICPEEFANSFENILLSSEDSRSLDGGGSGSILYLTNDERFVIKTIGSSERDFLKQILDEYTYYVVSNKNTLLTRIYGLYEVKFTTARTFRIGRNKIAFIIMHNVMHNIHNIPIHHVYDLKGSYVDRRAVVNKEIGFSRQFNGRTLKDMDLRRPLRVGPIKDLLQQQLTADVAFLTRNQIMDYSLLVGIHDCEPDLIDYEQYFVHQHSGDVNIFSQGIYGFGDPASGADKRSVYFIGIVDLLQEWSNRKRAEAFVKSTILGKDPTGISAIEPEAYGRRLIDCMSGWFKGD